MEDQGAAMCVCVCVCVCVMLISGIQDVPLIDTAEALEAVEKLFAGTITKLKVRRLIRIWGLGSRV
eukprot:3288194-Rhodomonas_salina.1